MAVPPKPSKVPTVGQYVKRGPVLKRLAKGVFLVAGAMFIIGNWFLFARERRNDMHYELADYLSGKQLSTDSISADPEDYQKPRRFGESTVRKSKPREE